MTRSTHMDFPYAERFAATAPDLPGHDLPWLAGKRAEAIARFRETGLPTPRVEDWKYTNLNRFAETGYVDAPDAETGTVPDNGLLPLSAPAHRLVFVNGRHRPDLSTPGELPEGVRLLALSAALQTAPELVENGLGRLAAGNGHPLVSLNTAFWSDGLLLYLPKGTHLDHPVHLISLGNAAHAGANAFHPRLLILAEENSAATLLEDHAGDGPYWTNPLTEISLAPNARLDHYKLQNDGRRATHLAHSRVRLDRDARYHNFTLSLGAELARSEIETTLDGEGAETRLTGGYMAGDGQHMDNTTLIDHAKPHCTSQELYKGTLDGRARGVFQGKIVVRKDAQKTDAHMSNKTLLLSAEAEIDSKPELEIYADDVKCGHGATAGAIDEDALFYLRARGIGAAAARHMLTEAFLTEVLEDIRLEPVRERLQTRIADWLAEHGQGEI